MSEVDPWQALTGLSDRLKKLEAKQETEADRIAHFQQIERADCAQAVCSNAAEAFGVMYKRALEGENMRWTQSFVGTLVANILADMHTVNEDSQEKKEESECDE
jgi:hypothetical protein